MSLKMKIKLIGQKNQLKIFKKKNKSLKKLII